MERKERRLQLLQRHLCPEAQSIDVCGIIAVVGGSTPAVDFLMEGLTILQVPLLFLLLLPRFRFAASSKENFPSLMPNVDEAMLMSVILRFTLCVVRKHFLKKKKKRKETKRKRKKKKKRKNHPTML
jgi:hypothetical protein